MFTISTKKWCTIFTYRSPKNKKKVMFFNEINLSLNQYVNKYDNIIAMGERKDNNNFLSNL